MRRAEPELGRPLKGPYTLEVPWARRTKWRGYTAPPQASASLFGLRRQQGL